MKQGARKFLGFVITIVLYAVILAVAIYRFNNLIVDISAFAVQAAGGFACIAGLFFTGNVLEHFADKKSVTSGPGPDGKGGNNDKPQQ